MLLRIDCGSKAAVMEWRCVRVCVIYKLGAGVVRVLQRQRGDIAEPAGVMEGRWTMTRPSLLLSECPPSSSSFSNHFFV